MQYNDNGNLAGVAGTDFNAQTGAFLLGDVANIKITGAVGRQALISDGATDGTLQFDAVSYTQPQIRWVAAATGVNQAFQSQLLGNFSDSNFATVFRNGILVESNEYTIVGNTLTINTIVNQNDTITVAATSSGYSGLRFGDLVVDNVTATHITTDTLTAIYTETDTLTVNTANIGNLNITTGANLGPATNVTITGGTPGQVLTTDGVGNLAWVNQADNGVTSIVAGTGITINPTNGIGAVTITATGGGGGGGTPGGATTQVQFNNAGAFAGDPNLTFDGTTLTTRGLTASGTVNLGTVANVRIAGGTANAVLKTNGSGVLSWGTETAGPVVGATANAGFAPRLGSTGVLDDSAIPNTVVKTVNGAAPDAFGDVSIQIGGLTTTGPLADRPATGTQDGQVYVVAGDPQPNLDGLTYIWSVSGAGWFIIQQNQAANDARYVNLVGDTMGGPLLLVNSTPVGATEAASKAYVDGRTSTAYLPLAGGTLTGALTLAADPTLPLVAATKQYVDTVGNTKLSIGGGLITGPLTVGGATYFNSGVFETRVAMGGATAIAVNTGGYFTKTITAPTTFTVTGGANANTSSFILDLTNGGNFAVTWFSGIQWAGGTPPTLTTNGRDILGFFSYNGVNWVGVLMAKDVK